MKIAIFGGSGFIGQNFLKYNNLDAEFVVFGRSGQTTITVDNRTYVYKSTQYELSDLTDQLKTYDGIVNLSSVKVKPGSSLSFYLQNVLVAETILQAALANNIAKYVQISSRMVYDTQSSIPWTENSLEIPNSLYGISKLTMDKLLLMINKQYDRQYISLRLSQVYGLLDNRIPYDQESFVVNKFIKHAIDNETINVFGHPNSSRDYIYIKDAVRAIEFSILANDNGGIFNIGSGSETTLTQLATTVIDVFKADSTLNRAYNGEALSRTLLDNTKASNELGYKPLWSLQAGIEDIEKGLRND